VAPRFPPSYWGLEHFIALTPYAAVFPPLGLLTLAALTPEECSVTLCDESAGEAVDFDTDADVVAITGYLIQMTRVFEIAESRRGVAPEPFRCSSPTTTSSATAPTPRSCCGG
jgi:hypothetical protein